MKYLIYIITLLFISVKSFATPVVLDFSSGLYTQNNKRYAEDGFDVTADYGFHNIRLGTLAWYETSNTIEISKNSGFFNLESLTVINTAFLGLEFESSKGAKFSIGAVKGTINFSGHEWSGINSFTIKTLLNRNDILNQIDNIYLTALPVKVSEPSTPFLFSFFLLLILLKHNKTFQYRHFVAGQFLSCASMVSLRKGIPRRTT